MSQTFNIKAVQARIQQVLLYAPGVLGNDAVNFFKDSFKRQAWLGNTTEPWRKRKVNKRDKRTGRAILVDSGRLRRSIRITSISGSTVTIGTDVPYARAHNEGFRGTVSVQAHQRSQYTKVKMGTGKLTKKGVERMKTVKQLSGNSTVKAHTRRVNLPRRQFMGPSPYLTRQLQRTLQLELQKAISP